MATPERDLSVAIVDDEAPARALLREYLSSDPAVRVVAECANGFEAVKQLRENEQTRAVPIVMVTSKAEAESMETGYLNGCSDYIVKPIDRLELVTKIRNLLGE